MKKSDVLCQNSIRTLMVIFSLLSGCSSPSPDVVIPYNLSFQTHSRVNDSAPLKIRVLILKSDAEFMTADFYSLQNQMQSVLGSSLLNSDAFFLFPGRTDKKLSVRILPDARYIGVMAEYQSIGDKKWRTSFPLPATGNSGTYQFLKWSSDDGAETNVLLDVNGIRVISK
ncbi:TPA: type VI secretion system lipoprotein TssJ [Escherichia coli]|nr:type VI secretion system lipoprotein TssJ [Escherichia coli]HEI3539065.1 type VI secretion system lipoprotein TssJ [Escherichia coli]HEI3598329.1 type VI secretion system lipoprotein TssJ [Escherichia coli]